MKGDSRNNARPNQKERTFIPQTSIMAKYASFYFFYFYFARNCEAGSCVHKFNL